MKKKKRRIYYARHPTLKETTVGHPPVDSLDLAVTKIHSYHEKSLARANSTRNKFHTVVENCESSNLLTFWGS